MHVNIIPTTVLSVLLNWSIVYSRLSCCPQISIQKPSLELLKQNFRSTIVLLFNITPWAIKNDTFFLIITLDFLGRFLYFLYQWKQDGILYKGVNGINHFTLTVSPHYLVKLKRHINSTFWSQSSCSAFNRTNCSQLSQKVVQCLSFPVLGTKFFFQSSCRKENFFIPTGLL